MGWFGRRRGVRRLLVLLVPAALLLVGTAPAVPAQGVPGVTMTVRAGIAGRYRAAQPLGLVVDIESDRLVTGTLRVTTSFDAQVRELAVELAAGTRRELVFTVAAPFFDPGPDSFVATFTTDGGEQVAATPTARVAADQIVGVLGALGADAPETVVLDRTDLAVIVDRVDPDRLATPGWLGPVSVLVTEAAELDRLDPEAMVQVRDWLAGGGQLVVDDASDTVAALPAAWQPGPGGRARAGLGLVLDGRGELAAGRWSTLEPGGAGVSQEFGGQFFGFEGASQSAARDAGLRAIAITGPLLVVLGYTAVVGPLAYLVLRRRRRTDLLWVAVPALAVVVTGAVLLSGSSSRTTTRVSHVAVVETGPGDAHVYAAVGATTPGGGRVTFAVPTATMATVGGDPNAFGEVDAGRSVATGDRGGAQLVFDVPAGGYTTGRIRGPVAIDGARLTVTATADDDLIVAEVTNDTQWPLEEVALFSGRFRAVRVGELAPGESATVDVPPSTGQLDPFLPVAEDVWPGSIGFDGVPDVRSIVAYSVLSELSGTRGANASPPGIVTAVGWTRAAEVPAGSGAGRTAVVGRAPVEAERYEPAATQVDAVDIGAFGDFDDFGPQVPVIVRVTPSVMPESGDAIALSLPGATVDAEVRVGREWQALALTGAVGDPFDPRSSRTATVPVDACADGACYVRVNLRPEMISEQVPIEAVAEP